MASEALAGLGACMVPAICIGIILVFAVAGIIGFSLRGRAIQDCNDRMKAFCAMSGLQFNENPNFRGKVTGEYRGRWTEMGYFSREHVSRDSHGHSHTHTSLFFYAHTLAPKMGTYRLGISREGLWSGLGKMVGITKEVEIGVPEFDSKYVINSADAMRTKNVLMAPETRKAVDALVSDLRYGLSIADGKAYVEKEVHVVAPDEMQKVADALATLAGAAEGK